MRLIFLSLAAMAAGFFGTPASAEECGPLKLINTLNTTLTLNNQRVLVPAMINGSEQTFMLDTGGYATQIGMATAQNLNLPIVESGGKLLDLYGNASTQAARVQTFGLGHLQDHNTILPISANPGLYENEPYVGLLALDYMGRYDVEMDFRGGKLNYFSSDHCPGRVVYWQAPAVAIVPMRLQDNHIHIEVTLNGHAFKALIDTGAPFTVIKAERARNVFGITEDSPGNVGSKSQSDGAFIHTFESLNFDGAAVTNLPVIVMPDMVGKKDRDNAAQTGSRVKREDDSDAGDPPVIIGLDVLRRFRLYMAFKEGNLYITPATAAVSPAPSTPAAKP